MMRSSRIGLALVTLSAGLVAAGIVAKSTWLTALGLVIVVALAG